MIVKDLIFLENLIENGNREFPDRIKFCIDKKRKVVAIDESMHIDMEYELIDDGSNDEDIYGGDIIIKNAPSYSIVWEAHPNIERNMALGLGNGREIKDPDTIAELFDVLKMWVR